jgi:hypothetical protein
MYLVAYSFVNPQQVAGGNFWICTLLLALSQNLMDGSKEEPSRPSGFKQHAQATFQRGHQVHLNLRRTVLVYQMPGFLPHRCPTSVQHYFGGTYIYCLVKCTRRPHLCPAEECLDVF